MDWLSDASAWITHEVLHFGFRWLGAVGLAVLGIMIFGWGYKKRIPLLEAKVEALEGQLRSGPQVLHVINQGDTPDLTEIREAIRAELDAHDIGRVARLMEVVNDLPQHPLGDGHRYAELPDGTNIVIMADGTIRLAMPKRIAATGVGSFATAATAHLTKVPPDEDQS